MSVAMLTLSTARATRSHRVACISDSVRAANSSCFPVFGMKNSTIYLLSNSTHEVTEILHVLQRTYRALDVHILFPSRNSRRLSDSS
ncbi:hypothetical protein AUEXF2481DRAFT_475467 [Aureobasidium subglaciale EXF-2481]|uniref:Uncharacterized protein n=1 Tax=Aureobasidium subglaciale (strain EXF-2481) TaxID=1043005 RepID=A0A074YVR4_AURSE|nr:uncharacterized protein AUEXF2481DRAFT_475467 [Aureobasidium subglaciale EXF-2481]KEQ98252.1 hypothetical protein AUEXF2481DRAFT_475467 [Aureobasidium subglaciale EXF-2481]